jgi:cell division protein FtsL
MSSFKPFLSLFFIVSALLSVVFVKMESRRLGYSVLKQTRVEKALKDDRRILDIEFAKLTRPGRIEKVATSKLDLRRAGRGQIVQLFYDDRKGASSISRVQ